MKKRGAGILLHISSLPSRFGIGDLGPWAYKFADFLAESGISWWQVLPLNPTHTVNGNCPYSSNSAFAGNTLFISPELLVRDGLIENTYLDPVPEFPLDRVNYEKVTTYHEIFLFRAFEFFKKNKKREDFEKFCAEHSFWLDDFALYTSLKDHLGGRSWGEWPGECRDRHPEAMQAYRDKLREQIENEKFLQYLFYRQWFALKDYCNQKGIRVLGDTPIYVDYDSAEVWSHQEIFNLNEQKKPSLVSGVPPDYFSATGQLWGNPVYRWDRLKETGYDWWVRRIEHNRRLFDILRVDHFRGFVSYWEIPAGEKTAVNGRWVAGPREDLFNEFFKHFPDLALIAEDLGIITQEVKDFINKLGFPGMKVLLFAFTEDMDKNPYAPHNHIPNCVLYTGTHDNNTTRGWFESEAGNAEKERFCQYLGRKVTVDEVNWELIRLAMMSVANTVFIPMQDFLGLGQEARMNTPATLKGNWEWRLKPEELTPGLASKIHGLVKTYAR
jgi:4-alpha-glucanotransferase